MTTFEVIDAKPYHVGAMVRRLRRDHTDALVALGLNVHRELKDAFDRSSYRWAWMIDDRLAGLGGITGTLASPEGHIWLALSEEGARHPLQVVKDARKYLGSILETHDRLFTTLFCADRRSQRFAAFMGFRPNASLADQGSPVVRMELRRDWPMHQPVAQSKRPFIVFGLPRSRTRWLSSFLSYGRWNCSHDLPVEISSLADLFDRLSKPNTGSVETGLTTAWRAIRERFPDVRFAVVRRPVEDVKLSASAFGWTFPDGYLEAQATTLAEISEQPGTLTVNFEDLRDMEACRDVFEHCLDAPFDRAWWERMDAENVQIDMDARREAIGRRNISMAALFSEIAGKVTIQIEPFEPFYRDAQALFAEHQEESERIGDPTMNPDIDGFRDLDRVGSLVIATARTPKEMLGYILFPISKSLENKGTLTAFQNIFFVRKGHRGLGPTIHAAARAELKRRGVPFAILRAGVRASGPKQTHFFKRLGAVSMGEVYSLDLRA